MSFGRFCFFVSGGLMIWLFSYGALSSYREAFFLRRPVQMILVLGGDVDREYLGVKLAREMRLPLVVSGGSNPEHADWLIKKVGIHPGKVKFDYRAKDTLGNFTSLVDELYFQGINHVLLVTSENHLPRAMLIGNVIAGSRAIRLTGIAVPCAEFCKNESLYKRLIDLFRAITWVLTGKDLKILALERWPDGLDKIFSLDLDLDLKEN